MRILFTIHGLPPEKWGGAENYTLQVARRLAQSGQQVAIFTTSAAMAERGIAETRTESDDVGVQITRVPLPLTRRNENPAAQLWHTVRDRSIEACFTRLLHDFVPDVVHFQHVQGVSAHLIHLAKATNGPRSVLTLHDFWFFCANSQLRRPDNAPCNGPSTGCRNCVDCMTVRPDLQPLRNLRPLIALPLALRNRYLHARLAEVDLCIAPSAFLREQYLKQGLSPEQIIVLENGIETVRTQTEVPPLHPLQGTGFRFAFVGSLAPHKGVHVLIDAFNRMPPDLSLTIIGGEGQEPGYLDRLRKMAHHPGIEFTGPQPQATVQAMLQSMDCLVVPSLWYENSPLVVQEAYAARLPVIASRIGALQEKVPDGETGLLFTPGSAEELAARLQELANNRDLYAHLKARIRPPAPMSAHIGELTMLYSRLLSTTRHG